MITTFKDAIAIGLLITAFGTTASAQGPRGAADLFERLDADQDGRITQEEFSNRRATQFAATDTDADGFLTAEEMLDQWRARNSEEAATARITRMIERLDENDDGRLSAEEMPQPRRDGSRFFNRIDADGDGAITLAEAEAAQGHRRFGRGKRGN